MTAAARKGFCGKMLPYLASISAARTITKAIVFMCRIAAVNYFIYLTRALHHTDTFHPDCTAVMPSAGRDGQHHDDDDGQRRVHDSGPGEDPPGGEGEAPAHRESPARLHKLPRLRVPAHAVVMSEDHPQSPIHMPKAACGYVSADSAQAAALVNVFTTLLTHLAEPAVPESCSNLCCRASCRRSAASWTPPAPRRPP